MTPLDLELLRQRIAAALHRLEPLFAADMRLTFVARHPEHPERILIVSSDDLPALCRDVLRQAEREGG